MAIAFRAAGARTKANLSTAALTQTVVLPTGHASGDLLLLVVVTDDNTGPTATPAGWAMLSETDAGPSSRSPYYGSPHVRVYWRLDSGSLGSSVSLTFSGSTWPSGRPLVLAWTAAYSGVDPKAPIGSWDQAWSDDDAAAHAHPQLGLPRPDGWLLTLRAIGSDTGATFTNSVSADAERVDDWAGFSASPSAALYDSGVALNTGPQPIRTTTASHTVGYGSVMLSILIQTTGTASVVTANAGTAAVSVATDAVDTTVQEHGWDACTPDAMPVYQFAIDWNDNSGATPSAAVDVTPSIITDITATYGRDQDRQFSPAAVGTAAFSLDNTSRRYSPENAASPLYAGLNPARTMTGRVGFGGATYSLFTGRVDDFDISVDFTGRTVSLSFLDGLTDLQGVTLSTPLYASLRTGELVNLILDAAGWTGPRDVDPGATVVRWWWAEGTDALSAINDLVSSEGPPAVAYCAPDGTFVFRDRHHRLLRAASLTSQATFHAGALGECDGQGVPEGAFSMARPFTYAHGWRDVVNSVSWDVSERWPDGIEQVWTDETSYHLEAGQSVQITVTSSDPFLDAVTPVAGTDFTVTSSGTPGTATAMLDRDSGASATLTLTAAGGPVNVTGLQVRGRLVTVRQTVRVALTDSASVSEFGERAYSGSVPWASTQDAQAIAGRVLLYYAQRRPTVQIRLVASDPAHFEQVLTRTVGDRVHIVNAEMGLDADFFVEQVQHTVQRIGRLGRPPVHAVVLGCEKEQVSTSNPFTFDKRDAGFDQGTFDLVPADSATRVFIFDDPVQGMFGGGEFGT